MKHLLLHDAPCIVNFSGGRSSGYMVKLLRDAGDLDRPDVHVVFCNTGKERPETLDFVHEVETRWDIPIVWLEYEYRPDAKGFKRGHEKEIHKVVNYESASRNGEPFESLILRKGMIPNPSMRICTAEMKVGTIRRWAVREQGITVKWYSVLGIRADEEGRLERMAKSTRKAEHEKARVFPLVVADVSKQEVDSYWAGNDFDLGIPSWLGNCDLCFMKSKAKLMQTIKRDPHLAEWWIKMENGIVEKRGGKMRKKEMSQFKKDWSYTKLVRMAEAQGEIDFPDDEGGIDCFCGD